MQPVGRYPIHIIVKNGRTMLLGVVDNAGDRQLAEVRAREVTGVFEVKNSLIVTREAEKDPSSDTSEFSDSLKELQTPVKESQNRRTVMATFRRPTRREVLGTGAAAIVTSSYRVNRRPRPKHHREASPRRRLRPGAPNLPAGFANTFASRYVDANGVRLHAVIGGKGRPLLMVHGWPQTWYQWRAGDAGTGARLRSHCGGSAGNWPVRQTRERVRRGAQANDMVALMGALGHPCFAMVGFDTGMPIAYALAAHHLSHSNVWSSARPSSQASLLHLLCWCQAH